jgi:hypothetical protein
MILELESNIKDDRTDIDLLLRGTARLGCAAIIA